jgi:hypothetical protein
MILKIQYRYHCPREVHGQAMRIKSRSIQRKIIKHDFTNFDSNPTPRVQRFSVPLPECGNGHNPAILLSQASAFLMLLIVLI